MKFTYLFIFSLFIHQSIAQTPCVGGMAGSYPCSNIDLAAIVPLSTFGSFEANDIWGWTDPSSGKEYAIVGLTDGTGFVDVSIPTAPIYLGKLPTHTSNSSWRDIKVYNNHAFIVSEAGSHGIQIFDLTTLAAVAAPPVTFSATAHFNSIGSAHNIVINETTGLGVAVGSSCSGGLYFLDLSTPTSISNTGCFSSDGYTHDAVCFIYQGPDTDHVGSEICIASNEDTQTIVDVSDVTAPVQLSRTGYAGSRYTHQGWITDDHKFLLFNDELDESNNSHNTRTHIWDISDLDSPVNLGYYQSSAAAIDHNLYVKGNYVFESNYRAGLRVLEQTDLANGSMTEVAYFDVYPSSNSANFNGAWSVYPYFQSGTMIVNHIEEGLFILSPTMPYYTLRKGNDALQVPKTICQGQDAIYNIDLSAFGGFSSNVTLSTSSVIPGGASLTFGTNPVAPSGATTLTVSNTNAVPPGKYSILIESAGGGEKHDISVGLIIEPLPSISSLTLPANSSINVSTTTSFVWSAASNADSYTVDIATDPAFSNIVETTSGFVGTIYSPTSLNMGTTYYWRVTANNPCGNGTASSTFNFTTEGTLPIELIDFTATANKNQIDLNWVTATELNNMGFEIQRKTENQRFEKIGWVSGQGNSETEKNYDFQDDNLTKGILYYYRLKQVDYDGSISYSPIRSAKIDPLPGSVQLSPNPVNQILNIKTFGFTDKAATLNVFDLSGKQIFTQALELNNQENTFEIHTSNWPAGVYFVRVTSRNQTETIKILKTE